MLCQAASWLPDGVWFGRLNASTFLMSLTNAISVDVEDYFQTEAMSSVAPRQSWGSFPSRVESSTRALLDIFAEFDVKGTFFFLGWVAERFPGIVRETRDLWDMPVIFLLLLMLRSGEWLLRRKWGVI